MADKPHPRPGSGPRATGPALEAMYRFILWLVPTVEGFPRSAVGWAKRSVPNDT